MAMGCQASLEHALPRVERASELLAKKWVDELGTTRQDVFVTVTARDDFREHVDLAEALSFARETRARFKALQRIYGPGYDLGEMEEMEALEKTRKP